MLSRCHIFVGFLPRWCIFWQIMLFTCVYLFCNHFIVSRCCIFHQQTAKMAHFLADHVIYICVFVLLSFHDVKMSHLLSAYCQDGASLGRSSYSHVCFCFAIISECQHVASSVSIPPRWCTFRHIMLFRCMWLFCCHSLPISLLLFRLVPCYLYSILVFFLAIFLSHSFAKFWATFFAYFLA